MRFTTQLLPSRSGNLGILLLNNPKPLHALTLEMSHCLQDTLKQWYQDDTMQAILMKSSPDTKVKAFCAGGDVKAVYLDGLRTHDSDGNPLVHGQGTLNLPSAEFFRQEYIVNHMLATAPKPQISFWDGIVMGGGVGLSVYGKYRVATEHTVFAMPETAIGLFPDVGSLFWMPRLLEQSLARYLAVTGARLKAPDLMETGLATHYVPSAKLADLETALIAATQSESVDLESVLAQFHQPPPGEPVLDTDSIRKTFADNDGSLKYEQLVQTLTADHTEFGTQTLTTIQKLCPTSIQVTLEGLRRGAEFATIADDLQMEFRLSQACMRTGSDFFEGIRAVLIDKDHNPKWKPLSHDIESFFAPIQHEWSMPADLMIKGKKTSKL